MVDQIGIYLEEKLNLSNSSFDISNYILKSSSFFYLNSIIQIVDESRKDVFERRSFEQISNFPWHSTVARSMVAKSAIQSSSRSRHDRGIFPRDKLTGAVDEERIHMRVKPWRRVENEYSGPPRLNSNV